MTSHQFRTKVNNGGKPDTEKFLDTKYTQLLTSVTLAQKRAFFDQIKSAYPSGLMTYTEFKEHCSILLLPDGKQYCRQIFEGDLRPVSFFFNLCDTSDKTSELLSTINQLRSDEEEKVLIPKSAFESYLLEEEGRDKMKEVYTVLPKDESGGLTFTKGDFIYELAHNFGIVGLIKFLGQPEWKHGNSFSYRYHDYCVELDTEMNQTLNIRKNKTAVIGWEKFPEILFFETALVYELIDHWRRFLLEYESGEIPYIIPPNKQEDWVIVPKEFVKDEYWEMKKT